jgi:hypothetical protein
MLNMESLCGEYGVYVEFAKSYMYRFRIPANAGIGCPKSVSNQCYRADDTLSGLNATRFLLGNTVRYFFNSSSLNFFIRLA